MADNSKLSEEIEWFETFRKDIKSMVLEVGHPSHGRRVSSSIQRPHLSAASLDVYQPPTPRSRSPDTDMEDEETDVDELYPMFNMPNRMAQR